MAYELAEFRIYTIVDRRELDAIAASGRAREFSETRAWVTGRKPHPNSLDTILTNPKMVTKEDGDGQQTSETDATRQ
jgi:hypothetical protein